MTNYQMLAKMRFENEIGNMSRDTFRMVCWNELCDLVEALIVDERDYSTEEAFQALKAKVEKL